MVYRYKFLISRYFNDFLNLGEEGKTRKENAKEWLMLSSLYIILAEMTRVLIDLEKNGGKLVGKAPFRY